MAASKSEYWDQLAKAVRIEDELYKFANANTPNFLGLLDTLQQAYEGNHIGNTESGFNSLRSSLSSIAGANTRLQYIILDMAKVIYGSRATAVAAAIDDINVGLNSDSETVMNRAWTYASISAGGSNVGTGTVYRVTKDKYDVAIESGAANGGTVKVLINSDKNAGRTSGQEQGVIYGSGIIPVDNLYLGTAPNGSAILTAFRAQDGLLSNGDFYESDGTGGTDITFDDWTLSDSTKFYQETSIYYRKKYGQSAGTSLKFVDNASATQYFVDLQSTADLTKPFFLIARLRRGDSCDGTLTMRLGSQTVTQDITSLTNDIWTDLTLGVGATNKGWYDVFKEDSSGNGARVVLSLASNTTGDLYVGEVILAQPTLFDGKYYLLTAGATDFLNGDYFTFGDTVANTGRINFNIARLYGKYFKHASSSPTYADAS